MPDGRPDKFTIIFRFSFDFIIRFKQKNFNKKLIIESN